MIGLIIAAEAAFWVALLTGLVLRYIVRAEKASTIVLACIPLIDLVLVTFVAIDVLGGAAPTRSHALAAVYLGVTVAFGRSMVRWADIRFRHRFANGPAPSKAPKGSPAESTATWAEWFRVVRATLIASVLLLLLVAVEGSSVPGSVQEAANHPYWATMLMMVNVTVIWFVTGPLFASRSRSVSEQR